MLVALLAIPFLTSNSIKMKILVIHRAEGFRHDNIPTGLKMLAEMAQNEAWEITATNQTSLITSCFLESFDVIIFLSTSGTIFNDEQRQAIELFVADGKGLLTIHSGTDTEPHWDWYNKHVGARFVGHPPVQQGRLIVEDRMHPATSFFEDSEWIAVDEWYSFDRNPRNDVHVLMSIDEASYKVDDNGWFPNAVQRMGDHPLVWYTNVGEGRIFQTALGHTSQMYDHPLFRAHILGAIHWTSGLSE